MPDVNKMQTGQTNLHQNKLQGRLPVIASQVLTVHNSVPPVYGAGRLRRWCLDLLVCACWLVCCIWVSDEGRQGVQCLLIPMCVNHGRSCVCLGVPKCVFMWMCVCVLFLANKPQEKTQANLYICIELVLISQLSTPLGR